MRGVACLSPAHNTTKAIIAHLIKLAWSWGRLRAWRCGALWVARVVTELVPRSRHGPAQPLGTGTSPFTHCHLALAHLTLFSVSFTFGPAPSLSGTLLSFLHHLALLHHSLLHLPLTNHHLSLPIHFLHHPALIQRPLHHLALTQRPLHHLALILHILYLLALIHRHLALSSRSCAT
ncbi:hypothetical protein E2C01_056618 [Portunus trituberculatus]|uniref:Uncharacterized protein n=1 Tax=Portunus trituberculatus TaxID=210409 RepID=A0A5B7GUM0_PORTR|nr:hypothetical protein [Portunus trituberculatus]